MSNMSQTQAFSGSVSQSSPQTGTTVRGTTKRAGTRFVDVLKRLLGRGSSRPVALVRSGREVSFEKIPFVDASGTRLRINKGENGQTLVQRKGRLGANPKNVDAVLRREQALSGNRGVARAIPQFRTRAYKHLKDTEELRQGIINGDLETPGNRSARLLKKIKEEQGDDVAMVDAAWLEAVKMHLSRSRGNGSASLKAAAAALKGEKGDKGVKGKTENLAEELADPRQPRVKKFAPKVVAADEAEHLVSTKKRAKKAAGDTKTGKKNLADLKKAAVPKDASEDREVVQRITIKEAKPATAPGEAESRSLKIIRQLKQGNNAATNDSDLKADHLHGDKKSEESVDAMRRQGWRIHTPENQRAEEGRSGDVLRGARQSDHAADRASSGGAGTSAGNGGSGKKKENAPDPGDLNKAQATQGSFTPKSSHTSNTNATQQTQSTTSNTPQEPSRGLQNLGELLTRMETSARILTGNGQTSISVRLRPSELGSLNIRIRESNGRYEVSMDAENEKALHALERHLPAIREHLGNKGIQLDNIQVRQNNSAANNDFSGQLDRRNDEAERSDRKSRPRGEGGGISRMQETGSIEQTERAALHLGTNTMETVG